MQKIKQIIDEIKELKLAPNHRSALRIHALLHNNRQLFVKVLEPNDLDFLLLGFEDLSGKNPGEFGSGSLTAEYNKLCENFLFHCNRVI